MINLCQDLPHAVLPELMGLAPTALRSLRVQRYHGDDQAVAMGEFTETDAALIGRLYDFLQGLFTALTGRGAERAAALEEYLGHEDIEALCQDVSRLGVTSYAARPGKLLAQVLHDVRGGGLSSIVAQIQMRKPGQADEATCECLYFLVRDHLKIMRNALLGLDDAKRNGDLQIKLHGTDLMVEKWDGLRLKSGQNELQLQVICPKSVEIAECCVEFGALDRILYNLLNNASRHAAHERIRLVLFPVPDERGGVLRLVLLNKINATDRRYLDRVDLKTLFQTGVSTTGSGYGLSVAAEFVSHAFGLGTAAAAVEGGYLGARLIGDEFAIWFHWPIVPEE